MALDLLAERPRAAPSAATGKFRSSLTSRTGRGKGGKMNDLGKSALMAYWSGRAMLARARSKITVGREFNPVTRYE
jgi:hypothetical protein